jgi:hypothetical protein
MATHDFSTMARENIKLVAERWALLRTGRSGLQVRKCTESSPAIGIYTGKNMTPILGIIGLIRAAIPLLLRNIE